MAHCQPFIFLERGDLARQIPFGGSRLTALIVALILAAAGALVNWMQSSKPAQDAGRPPAAGKPGGAAGAPLAGGIPKGSYTITGTVVNVADGDTVTLRAPDGQRRIRMDSIDAPEEGHGADQPGQPDAEASRKHLAELVAGKTLIAQCYEKDQYGREVCALILEDGRSANRLQVEAGYAWAYTARQGDYLRDQAMPDLQRQAKAAGRVCGRGRARCSPGSGATTAGASASAVEPGRALGACRGSGRAPALLSSVATIVLGRSYARHEAAAGSGGALLLLAAAGCSTTAAPSAAPMSPAPKAGTRCIPPSSSALPSTWTRPALIPMTRRLIPTTSMKRSTAITT